MADVLCPVHGQPFKWIAPGISKKTNRPYQGFWVCEVQGCKMKPNQPVQTQSYPQPLPYQKPENEKMQPGDWEERDQRKNRSILLQVAFKAAVELRCANKMEGTVEEATTYWYKWLLSQIQGQPSAKVYTPDEVPMDAFVNDPESWK